MTPKEDTQMKELDIKELQSKGGCCCHTGYYYPVFYKGSDGYYYMR
jgi:hypothetical protein